MLSQASPGGRGASAAVKWGPRRWLKTLDLSEACFTHSQLRWLLV